MQALTAEVERLRRDLEKKKKAKTTGEQNQDVSSQRWQTLSCLVA